MGVLDLRRGDGETGRRGRGAKGENNSPEPGDRISETGEDYFRGQAAALTG